MDSMGRVGSIHYDSLDYAGTFTNTLACPDIPDDYEPGNIFFLIARVYVELNKHVAINFSGLHLHGGTAPTAPEGCDVADWATRVVSVRYSQRLALCGEANLPLAATADNCGAIWTNPEMHYPERVLLHWMILHTTNPI